MGRVPLLVLLTACTAMFACTPEADPPAPEERQDTSEAVRDAGQAARDAMKKAGDALRRLSGKSDEGETPAEPAEGGTSLGATAPPEDVVPQGPAPEVVQTPPASSSMIEPIPDETERLENEQDIRVERDASVATQEAKEKILEATRRAAERLRKASEGMVGAFRKDEIDAAGANDTMGDAPTEPDTGSATTPNPAEPSKPE